MTSSNQRPAAVGSGRLVEASGAGGWEPDRARGARASRELATKLRLQPPLS